MMRNVIGILCLLVVGHLSAQPIAKVLFTKNTVTLVRGGVTSQLLRGKSLQVGDQVLTDKNSGAQIRYQNGTIVAIGDNSNYKILAYSPRKEDVNIKAELKFGKLHSTTGGGKKKEELKTPTIAMAILGTDYEVYATYKESNTRRAVRADSLTNVPVSADTKKQPEVFVQVNSGTVKAGDTILPLGEGVLITPEGMAKETFPTEGKVSIVPTVDTTETAGTTSMTSSVDETSNLEVTQVVSNVSAGSVDVVQETALLDIAVTNCQTF